jgi:hypothetical protein
MSRLKTANRLLAAQARDHDADLPFRRVLPAGRSADILHYLFGGTFPATRLRSHAHSFVIDENRTLLKSYPQFCAIGADPGQSRSGEGLSSAMFRGLVSWLIFRWQERDGPAVSQPSRKGFGSRLIERVLALELMGDVRIIYEPSGVICEIVAPLAADWEEGLQS